MNEFLITARLFWSGLPLSVSAAITLAGGFLGATLVRLLVEALLRLLRFDKMGEKAGFGEFLRKGGVTYTPAKLVSVIVFWALMVAVLVYLSRLLDIQVVTSFTERVAGTVPGLLAALMIVGIGLLLVAFVSNFVRTILRNAGSSHADLIAKAVKYFGVGLILLMAVEELNIGKTILNTIVLILTATLGLAVALAFGLGCKDLAREWFQRTLADLRERKRSSGKQDMED